MNSIIVSPLLSPDFSVLIVRSWYPTNEKANLDLFIAFFLYLRLEDLERSEDFKIKTPEYARIS